jgi:hypothetical protein
LPDVDHQKWPNHAGANCADQHPEKHQP